GQKRVQGDAGLCKDATRKSEYSTTANCLKSRSKVEKDDRNCIFLKILVAFCLVITKLFITLFGSLEGGSLLKLNHELNKTT
ncbi:MAG: hypothetical protein K2F98_00405, partial [Bacteroides sp.]|nr:hypothetical protein [Bacteroides sp.]